MDLCADASLANKTNAVDLFLVHLTFLVSFVSKRVVHARIISVAIYKINKQLVRHSALC